MMWDRDDDHEIPMDSVGTSTYRCECGTVVREGRECPECEYGLEEGGESG